MTERPANLAIRQGVTMLSEPDPIETTRVEMPLRVCLTFGDLLGVLIDAPGLCLLWEELEDTNLLRESACYGLMQMTQTQIETAAIRALAAYAGHRSPDGPAPEFVRALGAAVTRAFGIAPEVAA